MGRASRGKRERKQTRLVVGAAWYSREQWQKLRAVAVDPDALEETYDEWEAVFEKACRDLRAQGVIAGKVAIDVDALVAWCKSERIPLDQGARARFAAMTLQERDEGGDG